MLLEIAKVCKSYRQPGGGLFSSARQMVLADIDISLDSGEALGLVGESGAGKSTLARLVLGLEEPDSGHILLEGLPAADRRVRRKRVSAVFQDYASSINPGYTVAEAIAEPLRLAGLGHKEQHIKTLLDRVGLPSSFISRRPHELSGGQTQRVCLARAIAARPSLIVLDEALSSLDVTAQVGLLELLADLRQSGPAYLFITHDLQSVAWLCDRAVFLQEGRVVAESKVSKMAEIEAPYARKLLAAAMPF